MLTFLSKMQSETSFTHSLPPPGEVDDTYVSSLILLIPTIKSRSYWHRRTQIE